MTREECGDLPVYTDGHRCISRWAVSWRERLKILLTGRLWLWVWMGCETQPPVALQADGPFTRSISLRGWFKKRAPRGALLVASGLLCGPASAAEPDTSVSVVAAAGVSLSDESAAIPLAKVGVNAPLYFGRAPVVRLDASIQLSGLPGETLDLEDVTTWKALEGKVALHRRVGTSFDGASSTYLFGAGGFASRILPRDPRPRDRYARVLVAGLRAEHRQGGRITRYLEVAYGRSGIASPAAFAKGQVVLEGCVTVARPSILGQSVDVVIGADAHLNVARELPLGARDVARAWAGAGWS